MRNCGPTRLHYGHIFYFYQRLQSFNKMVASLNMDSCKFLAPTMLTSSRRYKFDFPPSLVYTFYCHTKKFAFLLPVAAYAFFFLTNVQNLYPDLHVKTQPKQQKRTSWAHTSYFYDGF